MLEIGLFLTIAVSMPGLLILAALINHSRAVSQKEQQEKKVSQAVLIDGHRSYCKTEGI
ncbi:hypothetical protein [Salicibibacter kimchii]|uniref:hypothetical protein n=1 Tax=Salicibibacter kimchii TaxID=2099786 RepID=UPI0013589551|nr:hypothetical protein [Salicibibacter kimchii]